MSFSRLPVLRHGLTLRHEDLLPDTMVGERLNKVRKLMQQKKVDSIIIHSNAITNGPVCYLTNYNSYGRARKGTAVLGKHEGPFLYTAEPSRNLPKVRRFLTSDIENKPNFFVGAVQKAKSLAKEKSVGLVGSENLLPKMAAQLAAELEGFNIVDLSTDFARLMAEKDEASLKATSKAVELASIGFKLIKENALSGKTLWELAAEVDYKLRLAGCEDTNILLGYGESGMIRPGYPNHEEIEIGQTVIVYIAAQYARKWGVIGRTITVGDSNSNTKTLKKLGEIKTEIAASIKSEMDLKEAKTVILEAAKSHDLKMVEDVPLIEGIGFDQVEYPNKEQDRLQSGMTVQIVLASDDDVTSMLVDILQITEDGGVWLS